MNAVVEKLNTKPGLSPREAAEKLAAAHRGQRGWLDAFAEQLDHCRGGQSLSRTLGVWDISQSQAARLFGVSRQAVSKWMETGVPAERAEAVADLAAATDLLVHYLQRERIPAVVRRGAAAIGNQSFLDLWATGHTGKLLETCRAMFSFEQVQN